MTTFRAILSIGSFLALLASVPSLEAQGGVDARPGPHVKLRTLDQGASWTDGFWAERWATCKSAMVPNLRRLFEGEAPSQFLRNFEIAAGMAPGESKGAPFNDGLCYMWLEAASAVLAQGKDPELERHVDRWIGIIAKAQRADGYLHTPVLIKQRNGKQAAPFENPVNFEMYNLGHLLRAGCAHHRATGKTNLLDIARRAGDFLCEAFKKPTPELAKHGVCPTHYLGILELYRTTREARYLDLARRWLAMRDLIANGSDDNQDRIPFRAQTQAVGHAARANYLYAGLAQLYGETGDRSLLEPLEKIWTNVAGQKLYITGGCGALYDGASPDGSNNQRSITRIHQAYGREYQLPNSTAHNETCAAVAKILWNARMLAITGEAKYADMLERVLFNAALAGVSLDGKSFFYTNTLRQLDSMPVELRWSRSRQPYISSFCCAPNIVRTIAQSANHAYQQSDSAVYVTLYGSSKVKTSLADGTALQLEQETRYPWEGKIVITADLPRPADFSLMLRIPAWAVGASITVNGKHEPSPKPGGYHAISRRWSAGDRVEVDLPMRVQFIEAHPLVEEARHHVAVKRGPLVYCLESPDLPKGTSVMDLLVPSNANLISRFDAQLLNGVVVLEGKAMALPRRPWGPELYRELEAKRFHDIQLRMIPYFAWANRGPSEMTVWLPLKH